MHDCQHSGQVRELARAVPTAVKPRSHPLETRLVHRSVVPLELEEVRDPEHAEHEFDCSSCPTYTRGQSAERARTCAGQLLAGGSLLSSDPHHRVIDGGGLVIEDGAIVAVASAEEVLPVRLADGRSAGRA